MATPKRRTFSEEFKHEAVQRAEAAGGSYSQLARELGVHPSLLQVWRKTYATTAASPENTTQSESLEAENRRLRRENASLREDRDILKKAAVDSRGRCNVCKEHDVR